MEHNLQDWLKTTKAIYSSVLLASLSAVAAGILSGISYAWSSDNLMSLGTAGTNLFTVCTWLVQLTFIAGSFLYYMNLGALRPLVPNKESAAVVQIRTGMLVIVISAIVVLFHIPGWGGSVWIAAVLNVLAYVIMTVGFHTLAKSEVMSAIAKGGFVRIFVAMILLVVGSALLVLFSWIPYAGVVFSIIAVILSLTGFVMTISGWHTVRQSLPPVD